MGKKSGPNKSDSALSGKSTCAAAGVGGLATSEVAAAPMIRARLLALADPKKAAFDANLTPDLSPAHFLGVRTPASRALAKELVTLAREDSEAGRKTAREIEAFLHDLPHAYFDEDQLHAFIISLTKEYALCLEQLKTFLPYVNNWATCDQLKVKVLSKHRKELLPEIKKWLKSKKTYEVRYGIGLLMSGFLDEDFDPKYLEMVASVRSEEYYINMMIAWYFATAMAKQYEAAVPYIEESRLPLWVHKKTIQKCVESFRITDEQKAYLKTFRARKS